MFEILDFRNVGIKKEDPILLILLCVSTVKPIQRKSVQNGSVKKKELQ